MLRFLMGGSRQTVHLGLGTTGGVICGTPVSEFEVGRLEEPWTTETAVREKALEYGELCGHCAHRLWLRAARRHRCTCGIEHMAIDVEGAET